MSRQQKRTFIFFIFMFIVAISMIIININCIALKETKPTLSQIPRATQWEIAWDEVNDPDFSYYTVYIYKGVDQFNIPLVTEIKVDTNYYKVLGNTLDLPHDINIIKFYVTATDLNGNESAYDTTISKIIYKSSGIVGDENKSGVFDYVEYLRMIDFIKKNKYSIYYDFNFDVKLDSLDLEIALSD